MCVTFQILLISKLKNQRKQNTVQQSKKPRVLDEFYKNVVEDRSYHCRCDLEINGYIAYCVEQSEICMHKNTHH